MKTITTASNKGGCGKSTVTLNLAIAAQLAGLKVAILDIDPQASLEGWSDIRADSDSCKPLSVIGAKAGRLAREIETLEKDGTELVIIDTAPHSTDAAMKALEHSDFCLIPSRASLFDFQAMGNTMQLLSLSQVPGAFIINAAANQQAVIDIERALKTLVDGATGGLSIEIAPIQLMNRVAFGHCLNSGEGVQEYEPQGKAANEVRLLWQWLSKRVEL